MRDRVLRLNSEVGILEVQGRKEQLHQPEDSFQLLAHRLLHPFIRFAVRRCQQLVRTVMAHHLRDHGAFDQLPVDGQIPAGFAKFIQSRDDLEAQLRFGLNEIFGQCSRGSRRADLE